MKLNTLVYDIREGIRANSDDSGISDEYIIHLINIHRNDYLSKALNNFQRPINNTVTQTLCVPLKEVSSTDCIEGDCKTLLRSTKQLPSMIDLHIGSAITEIGPLDRTLPRFKFTTKQRSRFSKNSNIKRISAYIGDDNYLYVIGVKPEHKLLNCISVTAVFENPLDLMEFSNCCDCEEPIACFDEENYDYPAPAHFIKGIRDEILNKLGVRFNIPEDKTNDANEQN